MISLWTADIPQREAVIGEGFETIICVSDCSSQTFVRNSGLTVYVLGVSKKGSNLYGKGLIYRTIEKAIIFQSNCVGVTKILLSKRSPSLCNSAQKSHWLSGVNCAGLIVLCLSDTKEEQDGIVNLSLRERILATEVLESSVFTPCHFTYSQHDILLGKSLKMVDTHVGEFAFQTVY